MSQDAQVESDRDEIDWSSFEAIYAIYAQDDPSMARYIASTSPPFADGLCAASAMVSTPPENSSQPPRLLDRQLAALTPRSAPDNNSNQQSFTSSTSCQAGFGDEVDTTRGSLSDHWISATEYADTTRDEHNVLAKQTLPSISGFAPPRPEHEPQILGHVHQNSDEPDRIQPRSFYWHGTDSSFVGGQNDQPQYLDPDSVQLTDFQYEAGPEFNHHDNLVAHQQLGYAVGSLATPMPLLNFSSAPNDPFDPDVNSTDQNGLWYGCTPDYGDGLLSIAPRVDKEAATVSSSRLLGPTNPNTALQPITKKKRKANDRDDRDRIALRRKEGSCFRCRVQKLQCDGKRPCGQCCAVKLSAKIYRGPCVRPKDLEDVFTFRAGDGDNGHRRAQLPKLHWANTGKPKTIELQWPFGNGSGRQPFLIIDCEEFVPKTELVEEEYNVDGVVLAVKLPPWACRNTDSAKKAVRQYMTACQPLLEDEISETLKDSILAQTWTEIKRYRNTHTTPIMDHAVQVFAGAVLNSRYLTSVVSNFFGVGDQEHTPYFFDGVPLPPQLTFQLQTLIMLVQGDAQKKVIAGLKRRVNTPDIKAHWYETFLTIFILLATIEYVRTTQIRFRRAKKNVSERNLSNIVSVSNYMMEEWEESIKILLSHFRCLMNGNVPFTIAWDQDTRERAKLDDGAAAYIETIRDAVAERLEEFRALRAEANETKFEKPLAAICELFLPVQEMP